MQINAVTATTTYDRRSARVHDQHQGAGARARRHAARWSSIPITRRSTCRSWRCARRGSNGGRRPGSRGDGQVRQRPDRAAERAAGSGDQALDVNGAFASKGEQPAGAIKVQARNVDIQQLETLLLQNRGLAGKLTADATISGTVATPVVDGHVDIANGGFQTYKYQSLTADLDYTGDRIGLDATLQQSPDRSDHREGHVPTTLFKPSAGRARRRTAAATRSTCTSESTALNLGIVQGFTTLVTDVTGTLEADVHVTGSGQDPHLAGLSSTSRAARFGVPAGGISYTGLEHAHRSRAGQGAASSSSRSSTRTASTLNVVGRARGARAQVGAVNITHRARTTSKLIDNELGDVGVDTDAQGHRRAAPAAARRRRSGSTRRASKSTGSCSCSTTRTAIDELPPVVVRRAARPRAAAAAPRKRPAPALTARRDHGRDVPGTSAAGRSRGRCGTERCVRAGRARSAPDDSRQPRAARQEAPAGRSDRRGARRHEHHGRRRPQHRARPPDGQIAAARHGQDRARHLRVPGPPLRPACAAARCGSLGEPQLNPMLDITATRMIPEHRRRGAGPGHGHARRRRSSRSRATRRSKSPTSWRSSSSTGRSTSSAPASARRSRRRPAASPPASSPRRSASRSAGRSTSISSRSRRRPRTGSSGAGVTLGQQIGDRAFFKLRQQFGERNYTEFLLEYQLAEFLRLQATGAPETSGSANRIGQRRVERARDRPDLLLQLLRQVERWSAARSSVSDPEPRAERVD